MSYQLENLAQMNNYYRWILDEFSPYLGSRVLEIGAGSGTFSSMMLSTKAFEHLWLVEPDVELAEELKNKFADNPAVSVLNLAAEQLTKEQLAELRLDSIVMVNVLEHIEDDQGLLLRASAALSDKGFILTFSPAFSMLYSAYDKLVGHCRRYTKQELLTKFTRSNLTMIKLKYFNFIGFFAWLILIKIFRTQHFGNKRLRFFDAVLGKAQLMEQRVAPPIGQSVIAIGTKSN